MSALKVDTTRLKNDNNSIQNNLRNIKQAKESLVKKMSDLDTMWDGPTSESFKLAYQSDLLKLQAMIESLEKIYQYESNARDKYDKCEREIYDLTSGI